MREDGSVVTTKVCGLCRRDCAGEPRIRDKHGRYFHRACVAQHKAQEEGGQGAKSRVVVKAKSPPPLPLPLPGKVNAKDDGAMSLAGSGVFDDIPDQRALIGEPCPKCGTGMKDGAVICTMCGYDAASGRVHRTAVIKTKAPKERKQKASKSHASGNSPPSFGTAVLWTLCGTVAAILGMVIWIVVAVVTGYEVGYVAVLVGAMIGGSMMLVQSHKRGMVSGAIAATIALFTIAGLKLLILGLFVGAFALIGASADEIVKDDAVAVEYLAISLAEDDGHHIPEIDWQSEEVNFPEIPQKYVDQAWAQWDSWSYSDQEAQRDRAAYELKQEIDAFSEEGSGMMMGEMFSLYDILWTFLAVVTATGIAAKNE